MRMTLKVSEDTSFSQFPFKIWQPFEVYVELAVRKGCFCHIFLPSRKISNVTDSCHITAHSITSMLSVVVTIPPASYFSVLFFFFCSSLSLYINFRLWTQNKSPWWEWSLKAWVIYILIVPHAFPFKIFGLRTWEVRNLYFEVFIKHSLHPLIYAPWDLFYVKHLTSYTLDKRNIWSIGCFGASHSFLPYIFIKFKCQAQYFKFKTLPLVPKFSFL